MNFCHGKLEVYYLRKHLEMRPELNDTIEADLPEECRLSSMDGDDDTSSYVTSSEKSQQPKRKRDRYQGELVEVIRDLTTSNENAEMMEKKLAYMEKEDVRRENSHLFNEWEKIQSNICTLQKDLIAQETTDEIRVDIQRDISYLCQRKDLLATKLGFK